MIIILIIIALIYCTLPWYVEVAIWLVNLFVPDTLPIIDELLMFVPIISKIKKIILTSYFLERYWRILLVVFIVALIAIMALIIYIL